MLLVPPRLLAALLAGLLAPWALIGSHAGDPFAFFQPSVTLGADERQRLDRGEPIARILPDGNHQMAVFAAVRVNITGDRLVAWIRDIADFKKSAYVQAIGRFSDPPVAGDLAALSLDDDELAATPRCEPGNCGMKLTGAEMQALRRAADEAGEAWRPALQEAFRDMVLQRVDAYLHGGYAALGAYEDEGDTQPPGTTFSLLMQRYEFLGRELPAFADYLARYPHADMPGVESFVYWSKERLASKPIVSATHVSILRPGGDSQPDVLVVSNGIFATHYMDASLAMTALVHDADGHGYLVYLNRSSVDVLGGFFGGVVRMVVGHRLKTEATKVLQGLRTRLESGDPPGVGYEHDLP